MAFRMSAVALAMLVPTSAMALDCDELESRVQSADRSDLIRPFNGTKSQYVPGLLNVESLPGITLGLSCPEGRFEGLGATLSDSSSAGITRWSLFTVGVIKAIAPSAAAQAGAIAADLQEKANDQAKNTQIRDGILFGGASQVVEEWEIRFETLPNQIRFQVDPAGD